jgi:two-component system sensor histidine kinase TctE
MKSLADKTAIRRRLLTTLFLPGVVVLGAGTVADYFATVRPLTEAYDQALTDSAVAIAAHVERSATGRLELTLPKDALTILRPASNDDSFFRVSAADGGLIAGVDDLPVPDSPSNLSLAETVYRGDRVRLASFRTYADGERITVTMGESTARLDQMREGALLTAVTTDIVVIAILLALIWVSVRLSLDPLRDVEREIARRSARDLTPLNVERVPSEIHGLVATLNRLFSTVGDHAARQRQFLDNAAHQLRTPLAGIQAQLELMTADEPSLSRKQRLQHVLDGVQRLGRTARQLLTLARADESATPSLALEDVDLASIVESCVAEHLVQAETAGIDFGAEVAPASVRGIDWLIAEALRNLVDNALKHTDAAGSVTVRCGVANGAPYLEVSDSGCGIPAEERERVVERFFRGSNARGTGSGLGLAIVKDIATVHGATFTLSGDPAAFGTTARLVFPYARALDVASGSPASAAPELPLQTHAIAAPALSRPTTS